MNDKPTHDELEDLSCEWLRDNGYHPIKEYWIKDMRLKVDVMGIKNGRRTAVIECGTTEATRLQKLIHRFPFVGIMTRSKKLIQIKNMNKETELTEIITDLQSDLETLQDERSQRITCTSRCINLIDIVINEIKTQPTRAQINLILLKEILQSCIEQPRYVYKKLCVMDSVYKDRLPNKINLYWGYTMPTYPGTIIPTINYLKERDK